MKLRAKCMKKMQPFVISGILLIQFSVADTQTVHSLGNNSFSCDNITCTYATHCTIANKTDECKCSAGYSPSMLENPCVDIDECALGNPCRHRGYCINTIGSFKCDCLQGWNGDHCQDKDGNETRCLIGYKGSCMEDLDECTEFSASPCGPTENCTNTRGSYRCTCLTGWTGIHCLTDVDECNLDQPCENTKICVNTQGSYKCHCDHGWSGENCSTNIEECLNTPCQNGGMCVSTHGSYVCNCTSTWTGHDCATDINECQGSQSTCPLWQVCINTPGSYACNCSHGWTGNNCSSDIDECLLSPCIDGGTCFNTNGSFYCMYTQQHHITTSRGKGQISNMRTDVKRGKHQSVNVAIIAGSVAGGVVVVGAILTGVFIAKHLRKVRVTATDSDTDVGTQPQVTQTTYTRGSVSVN